jgi:hypothetical protein
MSLPPTIQADVAMIPRLLLPFLVAVLFLTGGCGMFSRKSGKPKDTGAIASEVEEGLRKRFIDHRTAELTAQGVAAEAARAQATDEFRQKYEYTGAARK